MTHFKVELLNKEDFSNHKVAKFIESIGRISHKSKSKDIVTTKTFIELLMKLGHLSVFEHYNFSFKISNISRTCATQLLRHRHTAFTMESLRYVKKKENTVIIPDTISDLKDSEPKVYNAVTKLIDSTNMLYNVLVDQFNIPKEDARFILPLGTTTSLVMTTNIREWLHIINIRVTKQAQWEIREVISEIWKILYKIEPFVFSLDKLKLLPDFEDIDTKEPIFWDITRSN